ncbi:unnamed protein product [Linum trigynum]|uniref:PdxS/SNZ N-terminal domain-containing protein n=1 Tax=Linum trigynum TaxID=586398 RepID=A0AAV2FWD8_9ROSI
MSNPQLIKEIKQAVTILVMAKARIGHFVEAQILEAIIIDYVDESEVMTLTDNRLKISFQFQWSSLQRRRFIQGELILLMLRRFKRQPTSLNDAVLSKSYYLLERCRSLLLSAVLCFMSKSCIVYLSKLPNKASMVLVL